MTYVRLDRSEFHFMCCICCDWTLYTEAYEDADGVRWDMCAKCGSREALAARSVAKEEENERPWVTCPECGGLGLHPLHNDRVCLMCFGKRIVLAKEEANEPTTRVEVPWRAPGTVEP